MIVQAFIPDWPGEKQHARQIADIVSRYCEVTILNDPADYFNAQWEKARSLFTGDILLWIMADVTLPPNFEDLYKEMCRVMSRGDVGWYAPNVDWTCYYYDKKDLKPLEPEIYEAPNTDSLCFAIRRDVVKAMPYMDSELSYMWGMDFTASAQIQLMGLKMVRDYKFKVLHPNSTGYDIDKAGNTMFELWYTFNDALKKTIIEKLEMANNLKRAPQQGD